MKTQLKNKLPLRPEVEFVTYHRKPTQSEIKQGYGAIHYIDVPVKECCFNGTRVAKSRLKIDNLIYTRG